MFVPEVEVCVGRALADFAPRSLPPSLLPAPPPHVTFAQVSVTMACARDAAGNPLYFTCSAIPTIARAGDDNRASAGHSSSVAVTAAGSPSHVGGAGAGCTTIIESDAYGASGSASAAKRECVLAGPSSNAGHCSVLTFDHCDVDTSGTGLFETVFPVARTLHSSVDTAPMMAASYGGGGGGGASCAFNDPWGPSHGGAQRLHAASTMRWQPSHYPVPGAAAASASRIEILGSDSEVPESREGKSAGNGAGVQGGIACAAPGAATPGSCGGGDAGSGVSGLQWAATVPPDEMRFPAWVDLVKTP